ncbi:MAG: GntR family transcriptional regulator [Planctomycetota bacterium]
MTLTERIERDLLRLLAQREELPFNLSLSGIAKHFDVSPMPVRTAVQSLVDQGILQKGEAGRLSVIEAQLPDLDDLPVEDTVADDESLLDQLISEIITRGLTQDEHYLRESATADQYGVGRTVVRRVFSELAGRGLLTHVPRCGWLVRPYREKDTIDYLAVREVLEREALTEAFNELDAQLLQEMRDGNQHSGPGRPATLDNRMHAYWIGLSGNRYIQAFFEREGGYYAAVFDHAGLEPDATDSMVDQHQAILDALLAKDLGKALDALSRHIQSQRASVSGMIEHQKNLAQQD